MPGKVPSPRQRFVKAPAKKVGVVPAVEQVMDEKIANRVLPQNKRKVLEDLLSREQERAKRSKLATILVQKLSVKYGSSNKAVISALVEEFLAEKDQITGEDLGKLEKEVIVALSAKRRLITPAPSAQQQQQQQQQQLQSQQQQQQLLQQQQQSQEPGSSKPGSSSFQSKLEPPPPGSEWSVIAAYQELLAEEKVKEEAHVARMKKVNFRASLDDHIAKARELRAKTEDRSDKEYSVRVNEDVKKFFEEEKKKKDFIHKKHHDELMQRKQQILDKMEAAKAAKMDQLEQEYRDLAMAAAQIEAEKEKMRGIRRRARENQDIVDKDNQENNRLKELKRLADAEEDQARAKEYAAKMDAEEAARASAFQKRMDEMAKFAAKFENEGAGKVAKEERIREEQLLLLEQKRKEEADAAKEAKKASDRRARLQLQMEENTKLLERQKAVQDKLRQEDSEYQAFVLKDVDRYKQTEEQKRIALKDYKARYRVVLDDQKKNKVDAADPKSAAFVGREADINKSLLKKAIDDPKVLKVLKEAKDKGEVVAKGGAPGQGVVRQPMKIAVNK